METKIPDSLKNIDKGNPFKVPENYFETLHFEVMNKIDQQSIQPLEPCAQEISLWQKMKPALYLAAMFIGIYALLRGIPYLQQSGQNTPAVAEISEEEIYLLSTIDEYMLYDYLAMTE